MKLDILKEYSGLEANPELGVSAALLVEVESSLEVTDASTVVAIDIAEEEMTETSDCSAISFPVEVVVSVVGADVPTGVVVDEVVPDLLIFLSASLS